MVYENLTTRCQGKIHKFCNLLYGIVIQHFNFIVLPNFIIGGLQYSIHLCKFRDLNLITIHNHINAFRCFRQISDRGLCRIPGGRFRHPNNIIFAYCGIQVYDLSIDFYDGCLAAQPAHHPLLAVHLEGQLFPTLREQSILRELCLQCHIGNRQIIIIVHLNPAAVEAYKDKIIVLFIVIHADTNRRN